MASIATDPRPSAERGMALITVLLVMMLLSALMVGFMAAIMADNKSSGLDHDQTQAYAAAHAGLEKLTADLSTLFSGDVSPGRVQLNALLTNKPDVDNFKFLAPDGSSGYTVTWDFKKTNPPFPASQVGDPDVESPTGSTITHGPYQGFKGLITPYNIIITARSNAGGAEVRMKRTLQTIAVPVFQFGIFSETDLAFHAGDTFTFGGRVHTNGDLYLAEANSETLTISDRITAVGDVIRTHLPNGLLTSVGYDGSVRIPTTIASNPANNVYKLLTRLEGSSTGTPVSGYNSKWTNLSKTTYNLNIRTGEDSADGEGTGAKRLELPIVDKDTTPPTEPIDLLRRPLQDSNEDNTNKLIYQQRYYGHRATSLRILLSDTAEEITRLPALDTAKGPVNLLPGTGYTTKLGATVPPLAVSVGPLLANGALPAGVQRSPLGTPLIGGWIKIEMQRRDLPGTWVDVTDEILGLGIAGKNLASNAPGTALAARWHNTTAASNCVDPSPNAIIRLQRVRDVPLGTTTANTTAMQNQGCGYTAPSVSPPGNSITAVTQQGTDYWPNALYDAREGNVRDGLVTTDMAIGGIMHYIELDMNNLRRWLSVGGIPGALSGANAQNENGNGFIVYFSDRRNNKNTAALAPQIQCPPTLAAPCETGEYGWEHVVNLTQPDGLTYATFDAGEDLNANTVVDTYGRIARNVPAGSIAPFDAGSLVTTNLTNANVFWPLVAGSSAVAGSAWPLKVFAARANGTLHFRRALKIVNGTLGNIITPGLTIASENPVYIQGNFNATPTALWTAAHSATAIIADSVTTLSNSWNDIRSFTAPVDSRQRVASSTAYRVAIVSGKGLAFPKPATADASFGSDGGVHNFMRNLEDWNTPVNTHIHRYRGSLISFFISRQAVGTFKCCQGDTYLRGQRDWTFDSDFLIPSLLPPGTPMFRDVNTLTFRQLLRPNQ